MKSRKFRWEEQLGIQGFHYKTEKLFEIITKAVTHRNGKLFEESKSITKAFEEMIE